MTWRPGPPNPYLIADSFKEAGAGYKVATNDGDTGAGRTAGGITVDNDYRCVSMTCTTTTVLFRVGAVPTASNFHGVIYPESNFSVNIRLPDGENSIKFITIATGASAASTVYATAFKENS